MEKSIATKFKNMFSDIFEFILVAFGTLRGLAVVSICMIIYYLHGYLGGYFAASWWLILPVLAGVAFFILSWFIWFKNSDD
jgi:hypothetical protein